jgi:hypothetical protein
MALGRVYSRITSVSRLCEVSLIEVSLLERRPGGDKYLAIGEVTNMDRCWASMTYFRSFGAIPESGD